MKKALVFLSLVLAIAAQAEITAKSISKLKIPGERVSGQCAKYAFCLNYELFARDVEARAIAYVWDVSKPAHAIVLFKLGAQWWGIDNERDSAVRVTGDTDLARAQSFDASAIRLQTASYYHGYKVAGYLAELAKVNSKSRR